MLDSYKNQLLKGEDTKYDADVLATDLAREEVLLKKVRMLLTWILKRYSKSIQRSIFIFN